MSFDTPPEEIIIEGLRTLDCTIFNYTDVQTFLQDNIPDKKVADRFISWLVGLRIIHHRRQTWGTDLYNIAQDYFGKCKTYFAKAPKDPLSALSVNFENILRPDIENNIPWFEKFMSGLRISRGFLDYACLRLSRIFSVLLLDNKDFSYTQNLYVIGCVCLAMTSTFSDNARLNSDFAEAIAYYLTRQIISLIPILRLLDKHDKLAEHFIEVDSIISNVAPEQAQSILANKSSSIQFGIRYEILLFAKENHTAVEIFNIWDQIFGHLTQLEFIKCLTAAHIKQIKIPPGPQNINEIINNWKNWDTVKIIKDALEIMEHKRSCRETFCQYFCPKLTQFTGYQVTSQFL